MLRGLAFSVFVFVAFPAFSTERVDYPEVDATWKCSWIAPPSKRAEDYVSYVEYSGVVQCRHHRIRPIIPFYRTVKCIFPTTTPADPRLCVNQTSRLAKKEKHTEESVASER